MAGEKADAPYRAVKWLWLLLQAMILPLAAVHAARPAVRWPLVLPQPLPYMAAAILLVLWLIAQSLISMARFPLTFSGAALLLGGTIVQSIFAIAAGGSLPAAVYRVFFATVAALAMTAALMAAAAFRRGLASPPARAASLLALLPATGLPWLLAAPLLPELSRLEPWARTLEWMVLAANAGLIAYSLYGLSIFAPRPQDDAAYAAEWERWAPATIVVLILSAGAAVVLAGVSRGG
jgi:hypothetical protein